MGLKRFEVVIRLQELYRPEVRTRSLGRKDSGLTALTGSAHLRNCAVALRGVTVVLPSKVLPESSCTFERRCYVFNTVRYQKIPWFKTGVPLCLTVTWTTNFHPIRYVVVQLGNPQTRRHDRPESRTKAKHCPQGHKFCSYASASDQKCAFTSDRQLVCSFFRASTR